MTEASNVAEFPDLSTRVWRVVSDSLRAHYASKGWGAEVIEEMIAAVRPIYLSARDFNVAVGSTPEEVWSALSQWMNNFADRFIIEIAKRELELISLRKSKGTSG